MIICIEGLDGVGKTTISNILAKSIDATIYREPGSTFIGEWARFLLEKGDINSATTRMLLYLVSRSEIIEKLKDVEDEMIILDRFSPSTIAYQGLFVDTPENIFNLERIVRQDIIPDITIYLYNDIDVCVDREYKREGTPFIYPEARKQKVSHYKAIADSYETAFKLLKWPMVRLKTDENPHEVARKIEVIINERKAGKKFNTG